MPSDAASVPPGGTDATSGRGSEDRREEILRAGLDLFALGGFHGTSVRQIARAVGVNEATLYHYFPSKDAILDAVFDRAVEERRNVFAAWVESGGEEGSVEEILVRLARTFLVHSMTPLEAKLTRLLLTEGTRLSAEGRKAYERMQLESMEPVIALLKRLMEQGRVRPLVPERIIISFFSPFTVWKIHHALGTQRYISDESESLIAQHSALIARAISP